MSLAELTLENLRCIDQAEMAFGPGTNLVFGANGAGKTTVLEAIFLLGRGRSFRTRLNERLIQHGKPLARVVPPANAIKIGSLNLGRALWCASAAASCFVV